MKPIYNLDIPARLWRKRFTREQLNSMAKEYGVKVGESAKETSVNLAYGIGQHHKTIKFKMDLFNPFPEQKEAVSKDYRRMT